MRLLILSRTIHILTVAVALASVACSTSPVRNTSSVDDHEGRKSGQDLILKNLLSTELEGVKDTDVVVSRVTIPPNTSLPKHWHPGEEFAYVLDGSVTLWQKGKRNVKGKKGDLVKVSLKQVHTAITGDEGVELLVFRVHERGQPERISAE